MRMLAALLILSVATNAQTPAPTPKQRPFVTLNAGTSSNAKRSIRQSAGKTWVKTGEVSTISVGVSCGFFKTPPWPYEVQVFFVARNETTKERYIFSSQKQSSQDMAFSGDFESPTLVGTTSKIYTLKQSGSFSGTTSSPSSAGSFQGTYRGTGTITGSTKGSKIDGWIVRVVADGDVIKSQASDNPLLTLAEKNRQLLDEIAAGK